jgi:selenocysteine lyase/cysteine desulfurase
LNGFRHDLKALAEIVHSRGGYLVVDSAQAVGGINIDVKAEGIDLMSSIPYKWLTGPPGVGFFYIREGLIPQFQPDRIGWSSTNEFKSLETMESNPLPDHAKRFEYGTLNYEGIYALEAALDYISQIGIERIESHNLALVAKLRQGLLERGVQLYTPEGNRSPILSFLIDDEKIFGRRMKERKIQITARHWEEGHVRVSPHFYNNDEDVEVFLEAYDRITEPRL